LLNKCAEAEYLTDDPFCTLLSNLVDDRSIPQYKSNTSELPSISNIQHFSVFEYDEFGYLLNSISVDPEFISCLVSEIDMVRFRELGFEVKSCVFFEAANNLRYYDLYAVNKENEYV
jgi:hypothetical protein